MALDFESHFQLLRCTRSCQPPRRVSRASRDRHALPARSNGPRHGAEAPSRPSHESTRSSPPQFRGGARPPRARRLHLLDAALRAPAAPPSLPALGADPVELHAMAAHDESEEPGDAFLELLELLAVELDDLPAALADDVVVVLLLRLGGLVARLAIVEMPLVGQAALLEQLERPVDRGVPDARVHLLHRGVQLLDGEVLAGAEEHLRDVVALRRRLEAAFAQRLLEESHAGADHRRAYAAASPRRSSRRRSAGDT